MEQVARVKSVLNHDMAEIAVERQTACGAHKCSECAGCEKMVQMADTVVVAHNDAHAKQGDIVLVKSENAPFFAAAAVVYIVPFVLFFVFYFAAAALTGGAEKIPVFWAAIGFALGIVIAIFWDRRAKRNNSLQFRIVEIKKGCSGM